MNWVPGKVGAEPKKIAVLVVLVLAAGYFFISSRNSDESSAEAPRPAANTPPPVTSPRTAARPETRPAGRVAQTIQTGSSGAEFHPSLKIDIPDPSRIDPTLHLAELAKLKNVSVEAGARSLFEILAAPPPSPEQLKVKEPDKIKVARRFAGPELPPKPLPRPEPKAPPIPLKFYGFVNKTKAGDKRAFFLDGDDIVIASEGDIINKRYKIVRIGVNSAVVEDTHFNSNNQQTLPLVAELAG
ncbi:MAG TPA: hypothetical protein VMB25_10960 [Bryobacteraceae bacterium]|nr:hypothetical protein [Bryobacteraceae bacterium]